MDRGKYRFSFLFSFLFFFLSFLFIKQIALFAVSTIKCITMAKLLHVLRSDVKQRKQKKHKSKRKSIPYIIRSRHVCVFCDIRKQALSCIRIHRQSPIKIKKTWLFSSFLFLPQRERKINIDEIIEFDHYSYSLFIRARHFSRNKSRNRVSLEGGA